MLTTKTYKAQPMPESMPIDDLQILIIKNFCFSSIEFHMLHHLSGGLVDALFGEMAAHKASVFRVPHKSKEDDEDEEKKS